MIYEISGAAIPRSLRYADPINYGCDEDNFPPLLAYAIAENETIIGELAGKWYASIVLSADGGHELFQLTSSWPERWRDPYENSLYAVYHFLSPAIEFWAQERGERGDMLIRCVAAEFNAGRGGAERGHAKGNVDLYTTDNYASRALENYHKLCSMVTSD